MVGIRRLQMVAAAVMANGLLALTLGSSQPAFASSCSSNNYMIGCACSAGWTCRVVSGCTATKLCLPNICAGAQATLCTYS
jgi:hypothetical protein